MSCYLLVADVLGFSSIVSNLEQVDLGDRIDTWTNLVKQVKTDAGIDEVQLLSDTLFVREEDSPIGLQRLLRFAQSMLERGLEHSFPIRGAISRGDVLWGKLISGKPVIEAHQVERSLDWIGVACAPNMSGVESLWSWELVCCYPAPKKAGTIQLVPVVVWNVPDHCDLMKKLTGGGLYNAGDKIPFEHHSKVEHTMLFAKYLDHARGRKWEPKVFTPKSPTHFISELK